MIALNTGANGGNVLTLGVLLQGVIMFSAPGSLILQYAQNSAAGTTTLNPTSFLRLEALDAVVAS